MDRCPYYHEHGSKTDPTPCCKHKHAPVACFTSKMIIEQRRLGCGGKLSRCEIPPEKQLDVS
jgi:hypothetical protein